MSNVLRDFDFRVREPSSPLGRFVASIWYARGTIPYKREKIAPTGASVAVFVLGAPIIQTPIGGVAEPFTAERGFLVGPHDRPATNEPTAETFAVGIVTTPVGCEAVFGIAPSKIRGRSVDLEGAWPTATAIRAQLLDYQNPDEMLDFVAAELSSIKMQSPPGLLRCEKTIEILEADPVRPIADVAADLGVSHGHLDREFSRIVGLSPRALARLLRMRLLLKRIDVHGEIDWAKQAADLGWFDQPHLIRDFKRHTGVTPSQYVAAQRESFSQYESSDAAGFVPES